METIFFFSSLLPFEAMAGLLVDFLFQVYAAPFLFSTTGVIASFSTPFLHKDLRTTTGAAFRRSPKPSSSAQASKVP